jgi:predicted peptidase
VLAAGSLRVQRAVAITEVFGDGQKLVAAALEYDEPVDGRNLRAADFAIEGRTVTEVYAATAPDPRARARSGRFVVIGLALDDTSASLKIPSSPQQRPVPAPTTSPGAPPMPRTLGAGGPKGPMFRPAVATLSQAGPVLTARGARLGSPALPLRTSVVRNLVVDDFRQFEFRDPVTGETLKYNLFFPKARERGRRYPLVLFMHDADEIGADVFATLQQGLGATIWASPADQAKRPCFVVAPAYPTPMFINSTYATALLDTTVRLVEELVRTYPIDPARLYNTGQSAGAMMTLAMDIKHPNLFAASFVVAGEWNPELVKPLAGHKIWVVVAEGDEKAFPTQNAIMTVLEGEGTKIARATYDGRWDAPRFAEAVAATVGQGAQINYTPLRKGTVVPAGQPESGGRNHINTWRIAYAIEGIREWIFKQRRG